MIFQGAAEALHLFRSFSSSSTAGTEGYLDLSSCCSESTARLDSGQRGFFLSKLSGDNTCQAKTFLIKRAKVSSR